MLHGGEDADAMVLELALVNRAVVPVPGEAVQGVDNNIGPALLCAVGDHPLETGPPVVGAGQGAVIVYGDNLQRLMVGKVTAGPDLLVDGYIFLGTAGVAGINHCLIHKITSMQQA